ncbi:MAG: hypothetical protein UT43_C0020G0014 [Parcubacteria group bacterium GW2011_GWC1_39_29]|nr:MAG: hypothetical protein UT43_C0020G0014 [Parcubacteria group bacterium GW2011_GWC1_39_29]
MLVNPGRAKLLSYYCLDQAWTAAENNPDDQSFTQKTQEYPVVFDLEIIGDDTDGEDSDKDSNGGSGEGDESSCRNESSGSDERSYSDEIWSDSSECDDADADGKSDDGSNRFIGPSEDVSNGDNHNT